jgi:nucleotide-binding universal stress UspA family protein
MYRHLLVPTDGSELSQAAVAAAVAFARDAGARITFFHAQPGVLGRSEMALYGESLLLDPAVAAEFARVNAEVAESLLAEARSQAEGAGVEADALSVIDSVVDGAILRAAREQGCDLIFMASHGRRGLAGLLLGSETQRVLSQSPVPVLVYR